MPARCTVGRKAAIFVEPTAIQPLPAKAIARSSVFVPRYARRGSGHVRTCSRPTGIFSSQAHCFTLLLVSLGVSLPHMCFT